MIFSYTPLLSLLPLVAGELPIYDTITHIGPLLRAVIPVNTLLTWNGCLDINEQGDAAGGAVIGGFLRPWLWSSVTSSVLLLEVPSSLSYGGEADMVSDWLVNGSTANEALVMGNLQASVFDEPGNAYLWHIDMSGPTVLAEAQLAAPAAIGTFDSLIAVAVNNRGQVLLRGRKLGVADVIIIYDFSADSYDVITFPVGPADMNNNGDLVGGTYIGVLSTPGDYSTMQVTNVGVPSAELGAATASLAAINDNGAAAGTLTKTYTDGAGRIVRAFARYNGEEWDLGFDGGAFAAGFGITNDLNVLGQLGVSGAVRPAIYIESEASLRLVSSLLDPCLAFYDTNAALYSAPSMNNAGVLAGSVEDGAALIYPAPTGTQGCVPPLSVLQCASLIQCNCASFLAKTSKCWKKQIRKNCNPPPKTTRAERKKYYFDVRKRFKFLCSV